MMHDAGGHVMMTGSCHSRGEGHGVQVLSGKDNVCFNTEGLSSQMQALMCRA